MRNVYPDPVIIGLTVLFALLALASALAPELKWEMLTMAGMDLVGLMTYHAIVYPPRDCP